MKKLTVIQTIVLVIILVSTLGSVLNLVKFFKCDFNSPYKCEVIHVLGAVTGIGVITGYFDFGN